MKTENTVPLYKRLNEIRTQGNWATIERGAKASLRLYANDDSQKVHVLDCYSFASGIKEEEAEANTQYTAIAVNNLHQLAAFAEWAINEIETTPDELSDALLGMIKIKAKQALSRIS